MAASGANCSACGVAFHASHLRGGKCRWCRGHTLTSEERPHARAGASPSSQLLLALSLAVVVLLAVGGLVALVGATFAAFAGPPVVVGVVVGVVVLVQDV